MPVGTNATVKALDPDDLVEVGASIILANTYHLYLRPGHERIARLGGLHRFMGWDRPILTDSGGFQVVSLGDLRVVDDDGVTFRSHLDGSIHRFTPEHAIAVQEALGSDVAVALRPAGPAGIVVAGRRRRGDRADPSLGGALARRPPAARPGAVRDRPGRARAGPPGRERRGPSPSLPFDGICLGGLAGDESRGRARRGARGRRGRRSAAIPAVRYLMGLGSPADMLEAVHRGVDLFDSVLPARVARTGQVWVPGGRLNLRNQRFLDDPAPIQDGLPVPGLPPVLAGLPRPPVPGPGAPRLPSRDLSQPDLHPRLHGQDPRRDSGRNLPRNAPGAALARRPDERR